MCLPSFCVADTEDEKFGSNHVLTQEPSNMLPGCRGSEEETSARYTWVPRKKGSPSEETNVAAQILGLQGTQCPEFRGGE